MYYIIKNSTDKTVGNIFPQLSCINYKLAHCIPFDEFVNLDSELLFELVPKAKLTDVLSQAAIAAHGLLINKKVKDLLEGVKIMKHRYYKCLVKDLKGITHDYYWLHLVDDFNNNIDYSRSKFYWTQSSFRQGPINISSYDDYLNQKKENGIHWGVKIEEIALKNFPLSDMFSCLPFDMGTYISEKLKEKLQKENISGIIINESSKFI